MDSTIKFFVDFFLWPIVIPVLLSLVAHFIHKPTDRVEHSDLLLKDANEYEIDADTDYRSKVDVFSDLSYAFLSNAIWGISSIYAKMDLDKIDRTLFLFMILYMALLIWSIVIILHSNRSRFVRDRALRMHCYFAIAVFIGFRIFTWFSTYI